jgi:hypothetical protein
MARDRFRYDKMVEDALRGVVRAALLQAADGGLTGEHHFYITFRSDHPGVRVAPYLRDRYAQEMTIVLQYQFWDLEVEEDRFGVTLSFSDVHERIVVPFEAVTAFADPSVNFGLQFQIDQQQAADKPARAAAPESKSPGALPAPSEKPAAATQTSANDSNEDEDGGEGKVVAIDTFRKKS